MKVFNYGGMAADAINQFGDSLSNAMVMREQRDAMQQQQDVMTGLADLYSKGATTQELYEYGLQNPAAFERVGQTIGFKNDQTKQIMRDTLIDSLQNPEQRDQIITRGAEAIRAAGGDPRYLSQAIGDTTEDFERGAIPFLASLGDQGSGFAKSYMEMKPQQQAPNYSNVQFDESGNPFGLNKETGQYEPIKGGFVKGKSVPQTVVNNITGKPQSEFEKETQKINAKAYSDINKTNNSIRAEENKIKQLQRLNEKAFSGPLVNEKLSAAKLAGNFGIDVEGLPESEAFRAVSNELVLDKSQQMSGALSEGDMAFLQNTVPNLGNSKEGRASVFDYSQKLIDRQKEYAKKAREFTKEKGYFDLGEFESEFQQYADENPLFGSESQSSENLNEQQNQGAPRVGTVVDGWTYNGGDPADPNSWSKK